MKDNVVVDASRILGAEVLCMAISVIKSYLSEMIKDNYNLDNYLLDIILKIQQQIPIYHFQLQNGLLRRHYKIIIGPDESLRRKIIQWHHNTAEVGHSGRDLNL